MRSNYGQSLKDVAKIFAILQCVVYAVVGFVCLELYSDYFKDNFIGIFCLFTIVGLAYLSAWIVSLLAMCLGEITEKCTSLERHFVIEQADTMAQQGIWTCGSCGTPNYDAYGQCARCGAPRGTTVQYVSAPPVSTERSCSQCGHVNVSRAKFCEKCGNKI